MVFAQMFPGMEWMFAIIAVCILALIASSVAGFILLIRAFAWSPGHNASAAAPENKSSRRFVIFSLGSALLALPLFCCLGPNWGLPASRAGLREKVTVGMSAEEVRGVLGEPGQRISSADGSGVWYYGCDWWGLDFFMVTLDKQGRVEAARLVGQRKPLSCSALCSVWTRADFLALGGIPFNSGTMSKCWQNAPCA